uniref:Uncharacterized protein n=1 Tax=Utricularia reniformis TaxID=192314 RepID=A0A1Y0B369_9LAMI|nr:hypothetical protein AEK19_MT1604 [Utricularia reniformis]ART31789.1 hypothetical protein AEK19_MT1604 [Utricularia reniformis]
MRVTLSRSGLLLPLPLLSLLFSVLQSGFRKAHTFEKSNEKPGILLSGITSILDYST